MFDKSPSGNGRSTRPLVVSLAFHAIAVIAIFAVRYKVESVAVRSDARVQLIEPALVPLRTHATIRAPRAPKIHRAARLALPAFRPLLIDPLPVMEAPPPIPAPQIVAEITTAPAPKPAAPPAPAVQIGAFSQVKTGGFANVAAASAPMIAAKQVSTAGFGDITIVAAAVTRRPVSYSSFGNTGATSAPEGYRGAVRNSGFGDAAPVTPAAAAGRSLSPLAPVSPPAIAAQILEKPRPIYTEEARRLQIEGEVQLEVLFGASGKIHILRVIRGLGHGLDENAAHAAQGIRFLPAKREGRAVDSTALVHITFQLAS